MAAGLNSPAEDLPSLADVHAAAGRIAGRVLATPVLRSEELDEAAGCRLHFKCENLQIGGAFKLRGAMNAVWSLDAQQAAHGVATHSSGNHGAALARAARSRGIACHVVVPAGAVAAKLRNIQAQGAILHRCAATLEAREAMVRQVLQDTGAVAVPPYDDARVIAGQGTAALELFAQQPGLDAVLVPVGGGGLIAGTALVAKGRPRPICVIGAEPQGADDTRRSLERGERVTAMVPETIADGLRAVVGVRNFALIRRLVDAVWTADDGATVAAMRRCWECLRVLVEPSSAVPLAALLARRGALAGRNVGVILSGGNVDLDRLPWERQ
ncbi:MAG: pyridoxal-phosphate dependent enzyme [Nevskia sp.]|nr:pyridoxal-phosphate dependent enzyme [Nevskia sp.]